MHKKLSGLPITRKATFKFRIDNSDLKEGFKATIYAKRMHYFIYNAVTGVITNHITLNGRKSQKMQNHRLSLKGSLILLLKNTKYLGLRIKSPVKTGRKLHHEA